MQYSQAAAIHLRAEMALVGGLDPDVAKFVKSGNFGELYLSKTSEMDDEHFWKYVDSLENSTLKNLLLEVAFF